MSSNDPSRKLFAALAENSLGVLSAKVFWTQYIGLMLILLTFVIGIVSQRKSDPKITTSVGEKSGAPFVIELTELFSEKNAAINREIIDPVLFLLANHDLYAIFELPESGQKQAFALAQHLEDAHIPQTAFAVMTVSSLQSHPRAIFTKVVEVR